MERLGPQFRELRQVLDARNLAVSLSPAATSPEHVLVLQTVGPPTKFLQLVREDPNLSWLLDEEARVAPDEDFYVERDKQRSSSDVPTIIYMVLFNQVAIDQLLSFWKHYQEGRRPKGLGAWSNLFSCLKTIRRWGPEDRLRETRRLEEILEPCIARRTIPVEIELWATTAEKRRAAEIRVRQLIAEAGGAVLDAADLPEIRYHALLADLPHAYLDRLLRARDVDLILADEIYLLGPTPQCAVDIDSSGAQPAEPPPSSSVTGQPVVALLDGLPMENHPHLREHLLVDDPEGWAATYPVKARKHGTVENSSGATNLPEDHFLEVGVTCSADAGELHGSVPYALALSLEVAEEVGLPIYDQVRARLRARAAIAARPVRA